MNSARPAWVGRERLDAELEQLGARAVLVLGHDGGEPDLAPFLAGARLGEAFVIVPRGEAPRLGFWTPMERDEAASTGHELLGPEQLGLAELARQHPDPAAFRTAALVRALGLAGIESGCVALAGGGAAGELLTLSRGLEASGWTLVPGSLALRRARKRKGTLEQVELRRVSTVTAGALRALAEILALATIRDAELWSRGERLTVGRLKLDAAVAFAGAGVTQPRPPIVAPGGEGGVPHSSGTDERVVRAGESLIVDLFPRGRLFSDCTRTFCVGAVPEPLARAHADVADALRLVHERTLPGVRAAGLHDAVCELFSERGWPTLRSHPGTLTGYVHNLGHGVGYELHELPSFRDSASPADGRIEIGDAITLEPGLYEPGGEGFGVRLEDLVLVTADGGEILTSIPYDLDPKAWQ